MDVIIRHASSPLQGTLTAPPDKAICHRAVLMAALAKGETVIRPWPTADDCQRTLELMQALGVSVSRSGSTVRIRGVEGEMRAPTQDLFCGESGTTLRIARGKANDLIKRGIAERCYGRYTYNTGALSEFARKSRSGRG